MLSQLQRQATRGVLLSPTILEHVQGAKDKKAIQMKHRLVDVHTKLSVHELAQEYAPALLQGPGETLLAGNGM